MTRILIQKGSSSNSSRSSVSGSSSSSTSQQSPLPHALPVIKEEEHPERVNEDVPLETIGCEDVRKCDSIFQENSCPDNAEISRFDVDVSEKDGDGEGLDKSKIADRSTIDDDRSSGYPFPTGSVHLQPPPPPRLNSGSSNVIRSGTSRKVAPRPASPRHHCETEGYNSADEQSHSFGSSYDDSEKERQFEIDIRRAKGFEVKRMLEDGNCLFRAVADQVYGDSEFHDLTRQMCIDYMERERDHFSQFITEGFMSYCKRKRRDKVYGNNVEIQAMSEMYNRPIHIYSHGTEPINIFHGSYSTDSPPVRLSYLHGNHYNSLVDPRGLSVGVGLGLSSLRGRNVDKEQVKAALKAQQDQQIDNALLAEGRFYSDLELTEKEMEQMVMEASRAEYHISNGRQRQQQQQRHEQQTVGRGTSTSGEAEPSSSGAGTGGGSDTVQVVVAMGFTYVRVVEAYSIFGDDINSIVCYLVEMSGGDGSSSSKGRSSRKGKAATE